MVSVSFSTTAGEISKKAKAKYRAAQHPKGSGIGTNRYNNYRYDSDPYYFDKYQHVYYTDRMSDKQKAKYRAAQHPKGSGIGTNRYNTNYYGDHPIEKYQRLYPNDKYSPGSRYRSD